MKFDIHRRGQKNLSRYINEDVETVRKFARILYKEFGEFIRALVLFGSAVKNPGAKHRDLDVLIIVDDLRFSFSREIVETYRIIVARAIADVAPDRLHVQSMKMTGWWEYVRAGDPVAINVLRYGLAIIDTGFFDPLQALLEQGRIRPTRESIWTYFTLAPASLSRSKDKLLAATIDLYWSAVDSAHAALMVAGETPPSPEHVAEMLEKTLVASGRIKPKYAKTMQELYNLFKQIVHRGIREISGKDYDHYKEKAEEFVSEMKSFIEKERLTHL